MVVGEKQKDYLTKGRPKKRYKPYVQKEPVISKVAEIDVSGTYSYANYLRWKFEERVELIKGKIFEMSVPNTSHQVCAGNIFGELRLFLKKKRCRVFISPFDVRFHDQSKANKNVYTVLQPDVCVVCDENKIDKKGCIGAPDIVVEVLSPSSNYKDFRNKFSIYEAYGVREYWIVDHELQYLLKYVRNTDGVFVAGKPYDGGTEFVSDVLPGFRLNVGDLFED